MTVEKMPLVRYADLVQRIRAHPPSEMLRQLGRWGATISEGGPLQPESRGPWPWVIAGLARESLASGDERRTSRWRRGYLPGLHDDYMNLSDPFLEGGADMESFLLRMVHPQWDYRSAWFPALARFIALFRRDFDPVRFPVLSGDILTRALGAGPLDFFNATVLFMVCAQKNDGVFDEALFEHDFWDEVPPGLTPEMARSLLHHVFSQPLEKAQAMAREHRHPDVRLRQYDWNPLFDRPFTEIAPGVHQAVLPQHVALKASPASVYYAAGKVTSSQAEWNNFTNDFGTLIEKYVGEQLALVPGASLFPEVEYESGQKSIDWFFTVGSTTVLVECKSARVGPDARYLHGEYVDAADRAVGRSLRQVRTTARLVRDCHPALTDVAPGRTLVAWIVTAEPHHFANHRTVRSQLTDDPEIPTAVLDLELLEHAVGVMLMSDPAALVSAMMEPSDDRVAEPERAVMRIGGELSALVEHGMMPPNPILEAAWAANSWPAPG